MPKTDYPITPAVRFLRANGISFEPHLYDYVERGGTSHSSKALGVDEHLVIKTLVMEDDTGKPLIVLMHGDREVSTKQLARVLGVRTIAACSPEQAHKHTGYLVGGTSPFGTRSKLSVCAEKSIFELESIFINGGKRGFLVHVSTADLRRVLNPVEVEASRMLANSDPRNP
jgi:Cys-tRNA(Pro) deacylase